MYKLYRIVIRCNMCNESNFFYMSNRWFFHSRKWLELDINRLPHERLMMRVPFTSLLLHSDTTLTLGGGNDARKHEQYLLLDHCLADPNNSCVRPRSVAAGQSDCEVCQHVPASGPRDNE